MQGFEQVSDGYLVVVSAIPHRCVCAGGGGGAVVTNDWCITTNDNRNVYW